MSAPAAVGAPVPVVQNQTGPPGVLEKENVVVVGVTAFAEVAGVTTKYVVVVSKANEPVGAQL